MIHRYKNNGYNIIIDINSGSVHSVDEIAYDMAGLYENTEENEAVAQLLEKYSNTEGVNEAELHSLWGELTQLKDKGLLYSEDKFKESAGEFKGRNSVLKALCLHVAHDCNMRCKYCFAGQGEYCGARALMSYETGKRAIDFLIENSGTRKNLEVDFFGGEPTLNFDVVKRLTAYCRSLEKLHNKNFRLTFTTNGLLLNDEITEFCNKEMYNVVLSIDGRKEVNDRMRVTPNGSGIYDLILPKFIKLANERGQKNYYLRGTYTHFNTDFASDILHLADLGFKQLSMEPVVTSLEEPYAITDSDIPILKNEYQRLAEEMLRREKKGEGFTFYHYMIDLTGGPCIVKRVSGCGVGTEYMAVTPSGDLYPCHQFVSDNRFLIGNVFEGVKNPEVLKQFRDCNVYSHEECRDCFARLYCSGGCAANAFHTTGKINGIYENGCELHRKRIECAIMLKVALAEANE